MSEKKEEHTTNIRLRLDRELLERIDIVAGEGGRNKYIEEAIVARLEGRLPPELLKVMREVEDLRERVALLESAKVVDTEVTTLPDKLKNEVCLDKLDRNIIAFILKNDGATTPELAEFVLGDVSKRRTVHARVTKINKRAIKKFGRPVLEYRKGFVKDKRGAWWISNPELVS
ncbi:MAG: hypothetical protein DRO87_11735 [Candidatus Thorarchaeota archaeon]|nr:MAG: hypothetical protein DRO87_11735 [Candidatus Thorarchaeota archaeon]RLI55489.1 MAG: hypothetical protein DRP09_09820 [Candidatus Thorarchaeota archaeon]